MERKYFTWESWDELGNFAIAFYGCTVVQPFGEFEIGDKVDMIIIDFERGNFDCIHDSGEILFSGKFELIVKE